MKKLIFTFFLLFSLFATVYSQTQTLAKIGFEASGDTWTIGTGTPDVSSATGTVDFPTNQRIRTGSQSWQVINKTQTIDLSSIDVTGETGVKLYVRVSSTALTSGNGSDGSDYVQVFVNVDGAGFPATADLTLNGNNNARWGFGASLTATTAAGTPVTVAAAQGGESANNYAVLEVTVPDGSSSVEVRLKASNNSSNEIWNIDDVELIADDNTVTVYFDAASSSVLEGNAGSTTHSVNVTMNVAPSSDVTVEVTDNAGTATAGGVDYSFSTANLIFTTAESYPSTKNVNVSIIGDAMVETNETFDLDLQVINGTANLGQATHTVTITNDDQPTVALNEVMVNPPTDDDSYEYFELLGTANQSLAGVSLLIIEGDGSGAGVLDEVIDLSSYTLGSNGLFLLSDVGGLAFSPAPDANTNTANLDFSAENGTSTWVLAFNFSGLQGDDLDTDNDGTLDATPWSSVLDAVSLTNGDSDDRQYAAALGGTDVPRKVISDPEALLKTVTGGWVGATLENNVVDPGVYLLNGDGGQVWLASNADFVSLTTMELSPGNTNADISTCTNPTTGATSFVANNIQGNSMDISFTRGDGNAVLVVAKEASATTALPVSGTTYTANTAFGTGDDLGGGNFVVYNGTGNSFSLTGLNSVTTYYFSIYEYNNSGNCYDLNNTLAGNATTSCSTPDEVTNPNISSGSGQISIGWTLGACYDEVLVVVKAASAVTATPSGDGSAYTADSEFESGTEITTDEFVVYKGTGNGVVVTNLSSSITYHFTIFTRKGTNWTTGVTGSGSPSSSAVLTINEIDSDSPSNDDSEFIELYDGGFGNTDLTGYVLVLFNGNGNVSYGAFDLDGQSTDANGFFILGSANVPNVDFTPAGFDTDEIQNGADAVALYLGNAADFPNGTAATTNNLVDAIVHDTDDSDDGGLLSDLGQTTQYNENENGNKDFESIQRFPDGSSNITTLGITPGSSNLPVSLVAFHAWVKGSSVELAWQTESEENNDFFAIERSVDGVRYQTIGQVKGNGTTVESQHYTFIDHEPLAGINYYRLRQVDFDGTTHYSKIVSATTVSEDFDLQLLPTQTANQLNLVFGQPIEGNVQLEIYALNGQLVKSETLMMNGSRHTLNVETLESGWYVLQILNNDQTFTKRFLKL